MYISSYSGLGLGLPRLDYKSVRECSVRPHQYIGIPIPGSRILGSRTIFSIPNPGIGDALIPGFRDYEERTKCLNFR